MVVRRELNWSSSAKGGGQQRPSTTGVVSNNQDDGLTVVFAPRPHTHPVTSTRSVATIALSWTARSHQPCVLAACGRSLLSATQARPSLMARHVCPNPRETRDRRSSITKTVDHTRPLSRRYTSLAEDHTIDVMERFLAVGSRPATRAHTAPTVLRCGERYVSVTYCTVTRTPEDP
jgi:hypothetical protein